MIIEIKNKAYCKSDKILQDFITDLEHRYSLTASRIIQSDQGDYFTIIHIFVEEEPRQ